MTRINGYDVGLVDRLIRRHRFKVDLQNSTTFQIDPDTRKIVSIPFDPILTKGFDRVFKDLGLRMIYQSAPKLKDILGNPKDKMHKFDKSGIYEIGCNDCDKKYIGQTRRSVKTRFKEHVAHIRYGRSDKSSVADHVLGTGHYIGIDNVKLIKAVNSNRKLDAYESLEIAKNDKTVLNRDKGPIPSSILYSLVLNK